MKIARLDRAKAKKHGIESPSAANFSFAGMHGVLCRAVVSYS